MVGAVCGAGVTLFLIMNTGIDFCETVEDYFEVQHYSRSSVLKERLNDFGEILNKHLKGVGKPAELLNDLLKGILNLLNDFDEDLRYEQSEAEEARDEKEQAEEQIAEYRSEAEYARREVLGPNVEQLIYSLELLEYDLRGEARFAKGTEALSKTLALLRRAEQNY